MKPLQRLTLVVAAVAIVACAHPSAAGTAEEINAATTETLQELRRAISGQGRELARKAAGLLVFPSVYKAGIGIGGSYGEGVLIVGGNPAGYYNIVSASFGFSSARRRRPSSSCS